MISRKNHRLLTLSTFLIFSSFSVGCSTLFERHEDGEENTQNPTTETGATTASNPEEKDARIRDLERTVSTMTAKVEELESQVRAKGNAPQMRQSFDAPKMKAGTPPKQ